MTFKDEFADMRQRLSDFAGQFKETVRAPKRERKGPTGNRRVDTAYWNLRDLFTKDVTGHDLRKLVQHDTRETFNYFTREIDFDSLRPLRWYKRYPTAFWRIFQALAYRLSPPRRIAFAVAILTLLLGLVETISNGRVAVLVPGTSGKAWWFISIVLLIALLCMELRDKLDLKGDLEIARQIQLGLVPSKPYAQEGISIHCHMRPANTVGGDYFDIIELDKNTIGFVIGDVAGKGMPAALLMALLQGSLRTLITAGFRGSNLISKLNEYLCTNIPSNSLVTFFYGELTPATGEIRYVNAGHNPPFVIRHDQSMERLPATSIPLGINRQSSFSDSPAQLASGDRLLLFTDGVTEAFNTEDVEYGETRLTAFLKARRDLSEDQLIHALIADVLSFCGNAKPHDDMTLMNIKRS
ncbi:MAG: serine/threonine-protein phosphatase [Acidobacteriia bacterium]|nr:serine/threonine-protein phosphatase [Terriglobia bacterium]